MANVEQMLKTYRRILDENLGISWSLLDENGQNFGRKKLEKIWEKIFEKKLKKFLRGNESVIYISY